MTLHSTKVLVVGGGPTGLFASILLSRCEIPHLLVERREDVLQAPAAHVVNSRTMEIYRQAGLPMDELYALNRHADARFVTWLRRPGDPVLGQFDMASDTEAAAARAGATREQMTNISQHLLEKLLLDIARRSDFADIRFGTRWLGFEDGDTRRNRLSPVGAHEKPESPGQDYTVHAEFVLAADGAGSSLARALDIERIGPDSIATLLNLSCEVDMSTVTSDSDTLLYWLMDPDVAGTIIVHDPHKLAVYMRPISTPYESLEDFDEERCRELLATVFRGKPYRLIHKGLWKMTAQIAERMRQGNVFLIGDAAHRFPPTGGLGLNTGAGDVHNLVWKLAAVLTNELDESLQEDLLASYELERRPVAQVNSDTSAHNNDRMMDVVRALGLDPDKAHLLPKLMSSALVRVLPERLKRAMGQLLKKPVIAQLEAAAASDQRGARIRAEVARAVADQREHFSSLGLELGYVYREGCGVAPDAQTTPASEVSTYTPVAAAGARLPHAVINVEGRNGSTLDLLDYGSFTLLRCGPGTAPEQSTFDLPINEIDITAAQFADSTAALAEAYDLRPGDWLLVRPDGHVMARNAAA